MFQPISSHFLYPLTSSQFCLPPSSLSQNFTAWNSDPGKIRIFLVFVYRRCCFFKVLGFFWDSSLVCSSERTDGEVLHYTGNMWRFSCHAHTCFLLQKKRTLICDYVSVGETEVPSYISIACWSREACSCEFMPLSKLWLGLFTKSILLRLQCQQ